MPSKEQIHSSDKSQSRHQVLRPEAQSAEIQDQQMIPVNAAQKTGMAPQLLTPREVSQLQRTIGNRVVSRLLAQTTRHQPIQKAENRTGLPDDLKTGIEDLSGYSMDDVKVHYNSDKPAELQSHAYAQGTDIHIASGQEKHLPHEAWHVVQQAQGRVQPMIQMKDGVSVNDDEGLEREADVMGTMALRSSTLDDGAPLGAFTGTPAPDGRHITPAAAASIRTSVLQRKKVSDTKLNVIGENHSKSKENRQGESYVAYEEAKGNYWTEDRFQTQKGRHGESQKLRFLDWVVQFVEEGETAIAHLDGYISSVEGEIEIKKNFEKETNEEEKKIYKEILDKTYPELFEQESSFIKQWINKIFQAGNQWGSLAENEQKELAGVFDNLKIIYDKANDFLKNKKEEDRISRLKKDAEDIKSLYEKLKGDSQIAGQNSSAIVHDRSMYMLNSAMEGKDMRGIWKIGEMHLSDMRQASVYKDAQFISLSDEEFYEEYGKMIADNNKRVNQEREWGEGEDLAFWKNFSQASSATSSSQSLATVTKEPGQEDSQKKP